ncbi:hypothetical protein R1sor_009988 [Riccia sorocarpa]|uniref:Protein kinase domain-containing protein n=1 Tax=Riccia sorocarpa TaxID=122646 RepID=A0ABD3HWN9_9MARC
MGPPGFAVMKALNRDEDIALYYTIHDPIGTGAYGQTFAVSPLDDPDKRYCMKIQPKKTANSSGDSSASESHGNPELELMRLFKEIVILNRILPKHPNIVEMIDVLVAPEQVFIVTELCQETMERFFPQCDEASARRAYGQLLDAVDLCHQHGVTHDDVKMENILFLDADCMQLKLIDFGIAEYRPEHAVKRHNNFDPLEWFSPDEVLPTRNPNILQDDIDSLSNLLLAMMCGKPVPFVTTIKKLQTWYRPRIERFSPAAMDLLSKIGPKPYGPDNKRDILKLDQIRQHPWLTGEEFHPPARNVKELLSQLEHDLTVLKPLLKDWMVTPMQILAQNQVIIPEYEIVGPLKRGDQETGIQLVKGTARIPDPRAMKVIQASDSNPPIRIYLQMLIMLRILPPHIAYAVRHMHHHGVVHMDLHPSHIVFATNEFTQVRIVNCSKVLYVPQLAHFRYESFEPEKYLTLELLEQMAREADFQADISALGRILLAMMYKGWVPALTLVGDGELGTEFHSDAFDLLSKIGPEPYGPAQQDRNITIDAVCNHPWLRTSSVC